MATPTWRFPVVTPNQQTVPADFARLVDAIESVPARLAEHLLLDPTTDGARGVVLWGLKVEDISNLVNTRRIRVKKGAALLPDSAGDRRWHLAVLYNDVVVDLAAVDGGARTDLVELKLQDLGDVQEVRKFRVVGPGGQAVENRNVPTMRKPVGTVNVIQGAGANSSLDAVRLASVALDGEGAIDGVNDLRAFLLTADAGAGADGHHRGLRGWVEYVRSRLAELGVHEGRLDGHDGAIAVLQAVDAALAAKDVELEAADAALALRTARASLIVRTSGGGWEWRGENIAAIEEVAEGHWRFRLDANVVPGVENGRYVVTPTAATVGALSLSMRPTIVNHWIEITNDVPWIHVETLDWDIDNQPKPTRLRLPFTVQVHGEIAEGGGWNAGA